MLGMDPGGSGLIITLGFGTGGTPPTPPPTPTVTTGGGVRNRHREPARRRWGLKRRDRTYYFETLDELQKFAEATLEAEPGKKEKPAKIIVPVETVQEARAAGYSGLQKLADRMDYEALKKIEAIAFEDKSDDEDFRDFMQFLRTLDG
jgi:hypothetical protein